MKASPMTLVAPKEGAGGGTPDQGASDGAVAGG